MCRRFCAQNVQFVSVSEVKLTSRTTTQMENGKAPRLIMANENFSKTNGGRTVHIPDVRNDCQASTLTVGRSEKPWIKDITLQRQH